MITKGINMFMIDETVIKVILKIQVICCFMMIGIFAPGASLATVECDEFKAMNLTSCGEFTMYNGIVLSTYVLFLSLIFFIWMMCDDYNQDGFFERGTFRCVSPVITGLYTSISTLLVTNLIDLLKELTVFNLPWPVTRSVKLIFFFYSLL